MRNGLSWFSKDFFVGEQGFWSSKKRNRIIPLIIKDLLLKNEGFEVPKKSKKTS